MFAAAFKASVAREALRYQQLIRGKHLGMARSRSTASTASAVLVGAVSESRLRHERRTPMASAKRPDRSARCLCPPPASRPPISPNAEHPPARRATAINRTRDSWHARVSGRFASSAFPAPQARPSTGCLSACRQWESWGWSGLAARGQHLRHAAELLLDPGANLLGLHGLSDQVKIVIPGGVADRLQERHDQFSAPLRPDECHRAPKRVGTWWNHVLESPGCKD